MDTAVSAGGLALLALALAAGGALAGFLAGLFGIGGGGVLVVVLYEVLGGVGLDESVRMHVAVGTSLAVMAPTSLRSFLAHRRKGAVDMALLTRFAPPVVVGVLIGIFVAKAASGAVLQPVWIAFSTLLAARLVFAPAHWRLGDDVPRSLLVELYAVAVGVASTVMSIGGGAFMTGFMTLYGRPIHQAVATSAGIGPLIAVPGALGFMWAGWGAAHLPPASLGYVSLLGAALIIPVSLLAAPWGVRVSHGISRRSLEVGFALFLATVAVKFAVGLAM